MPAMSIRLDDLLKALDCDTVPLLERQRVIGGLQLDTRPRGIGAQMHIGLEMQGFRVSWQRVTEPAEVRRFLDAVRGLEERQIPLEVLTAERDPYAIDERVRTPLYRYLQTTPNEEILVSDDTGIRRDDGVAFSLHV